MNVFLAYEIEEEENDSDYYISYKLVEQYHIGIYSSLEKAYEAIQPILSKKQDMRYVAKVCVEEWIIDGVRVSTTWYPPVSYNGY
jgi:adenosine deaminase